MIYDNRNKVMIRMLGYIVYTIIDSWIYLDYLCLFQYKWSKYDRKFEKQSSMIFLRWEYLKFW